MHLSELLYHHLRLSNAPTYLLQYFIVLVKWGIKVYVLYAPNPHEFFLCYTVHVGWGLVFICSYWLCKWMERAVDSFCTHGKQCFKQHYLLVCELHRECSVVLHVCAMHTEISLCYLITVSVLSTLIDKMASVWDSELVICHRIHHLPSFEYLHCVCCTGTMTQGYSSFSRSQT